MMLNGASGRCSPRAATRSRRASRRTRGRPPSRRARCAADRPRRRCRRPVARREQQLRVGIGNAVQTGGVAPAPSARPRRRRATPRNTGVSIRLAAQIRPPRRARRRRVATRRRCGPSPVERGVVGRRAPSINAGRSGACIAMQADAARHVGKGRQRRGIDHRGACSITGASIDRVRLRCRHARYASRHCCTTVSTLACAAMCGVTGLRAVLPRPVLGLRRFALGRRARAPARWPSSSSPCRSASTTCSPRPTLTGRRRAAAGSAAPSSNHARRSAAGVQTRDVAARQQSQQPRPAVDRRAGRSRDAAPSLATS